MIQAPRFLEIKWVVALLMLCGCVAQSVPAQDGNTYEPHPKGSLTFNKDIAPIVFKSCSGCHRAGEVAPFPLLSYQDVSKRAKQIARVTDSRYMPPWKAEEGHGEFLDARRLSVEQIGMFTQWVEEGSVEGAAADLPPAPKFAEGWALGEPDMVLKMPAPYTLAAEGRDVFRCFVLKLDIPDDVYVTALDYRPSNRKIVHHALFFLDSIGIARKKDEADPLPGFGSFGSPGFLPTGNLGAWAPGVTPHHLPEGMGRPVKKGSDLVIQIHFHPSGKEEQEQSTVGLYLAKKTPEKLIAQIEIASRKIDIAPGAKNYKIRKQFVTPIDAEVIGVTPHAHYICKDMRVDATFPDGTKQPMIWIKDWDFGWQDQYIYAHPLRFPKGTKIDMEYTYDNSADNPRNPNSPPKRVTFGQQTMDEMGLVFISYVSTTKIASAQMRLSMLLNMLKGDPPAEDADKGTMAELIKKFDKNGDGKLDDAERDEARKAMRQKFFGGK